MFEEVIVLKRALSMMHNDFRIRRLIAKALTVIFLLVAGISEAKADQHLSDYQLRKDIESTLSAFVFDAQWAKTVPDTVIAIYSAESGFGVAILKYNLKRYSKSWERRCEHQHTSRQQHHHYPRN